MNSEAGSKTQHVAANTQKQSRRNDYPWKKVINHNVEFEPSFIAAAFWSPSSPVLSSCIL